MNSTSTFGRIKQAIGGFFTILFLYLIPEAIYAFMKYEWYDFELDPYLAKIIQISCIALTYLVLYSAVRLVTIHNQSLREEYYALSRRPKKLGEKLLFFIQDTTTQIGAVAFGALHFVLPTNLLIMPLLDIVPGASEKGSTQTMVVIVHLALLYLISLMSELTAMEYWRNNRMTNQSTGRKKDKSDDSFSSGLYRTFFIYLGGTLALCNGLPILISVFPLFKELLVNPFTLFVIVCVILIPLIYRPIRAIVKRRDFLRKLDTVCRQQGIALSDIDLPYRSIFSTTETESFTVTVNGKRYACKLIGAIKRGSPMGIFQNGEGAIATHIRFARITLFSRVTQFEFGFASEDQKILIINPVPKKLYRTENGKTTELDNGDVVDGYKVYTASGFLGALERGSIDR